MKYRLADGGDKIAAFERGMSDEDAHLAFETAGVTAYIVDEKFLVAYRVIGPRLSVIVRMRLYGPPGGEQLVYEFISNEAKFFGCTEIRELPL